MHELVNDSWNEPFKLVHLKLRHTNRAKLAEVLDECLSEIGILEWQERWSFENESWQVIVNQISDPPKPIGIHLGPL